MENPKLDAASMLPAGRPCPRLLKDLCITLLLWGYFTAGFMIFFAPFYLLSYLFARDRRAAFQRLNCFFYRGFFVLCRQLVPRHRWDIHPSVRRIRSAVVICNHVSYLDSILLISMYPRHTTIAKDRLFAIPIFGPFLKLSGYIPSSGRGRYADLLLDSLEAISANLEKGGNIIVFPEGTRSRDGRMGRLQPGAFKIAKYCRAPVKVLSIRNTDKLFPPGKFLFSTCIDNVIGLRVVAELQPDYDNASSVVKDLIAEVGTLLEGSENSLDGSENSTDNNRTIEETLP
jgi:1-acyl-sn-glycerol-3-phosphate acyltransferase